MRFRPAAATRPRALGQDRREGSTSAFRNRIALSANVPVEISRLYSTGKMISAFVSPSEKNNEN